MTKDDTQPFCFSKVERNTGSLGAGSDTSVGGGYIECYLFGLV